MTALPRTLAPAPVADTPSTLHRVIHAPETAFTRWLVRWRFWFFAGLALLIVVQFNGQWRIGLDSSIYRGVADSLAAGGPYAFAGRRQTQIYPGLPVLLAGLQRVFGTSLVPPLILMNGLALLTLAGVYQLIKRRYPLWIAVAVTCGVGMNSRFLIQSQEIMTDMPFLCAVVWAMLGWEWLGTETKRGRLIGVAAMMTVSLFVAATMRPTFWVLAAAWALAALWNVIRRRERRSLIALGVLAVVLGAFVVVDPRARGMGLLQGAYEKQLVMILPDLAERMRANAATLFSQEIPEAFFNEAMGGWVVAFAFSFLLLVGAVLVMRREPLWGLQVLILTAIMLAISDVPRYYLMVLPTLWLGYLLAVLLLTARARPVVRDVTLFAMMSVANFQNLGGALRLGFEQHHRPFVNDYKHGAYLPAIEMAKVLRERLGPNDVIVGPGAQVLSYLSGRQVVNGRLLGFDVQKPSHYPEMLAAARPNYVIGPAKEYDKKDAELFKLLTHSVVVPGRLVAKVTVPGATTADKPVALWLAEAKVVVPAGDWRQTPRVKPFPLAATTTTRRRNESALAAHNRLVKAQRYHRQIKAQHAARAAVLAERARKQRKLRRAATQASKAATQPTSLLWPLPPSQLSWPAPFDFATFRPLRSMPS